MAVIIYGQQPQCTRSTRKHCELSPAGKRRQGAGSTVGCRQGYIHTHIYTYINRIRGLADIQFAVCSTVGIVGLINAILASTSHHQFHRVFSRLIRRSSRVCRAFAISNQPINSIPITLCWSVDDYLFSPLQIQKLLLNIYAVIHYFKTKRILLWVTLDSGIQIRKEKIFVSFFIFMCVLIYSYPI